MKTNYDIFISYRRVGGAVTARHIYDLLKSDGYSVSFDVDTLRHGDFDKQLYERIDHCKDFILIVDKHTFDRSIDPNFNPAHDWVRCELAYALKKNKNVIPILLAGVKKFPDNLPEDIAGVAVKSGPSYNRDYFDSFYAQLKERFLLSRPSRRGQLVLWSAIVVLALALLGFLGWRFLPPLLPGETTEVIDGYVDLGLESGTLWKSENETGFYTYEDAMATFGGELPTQDQLVELRKMCNWIWQGDGYKVVGPNGQYITLSASGCLQCDGTPDDVGEYGYYWSSTPHMDTQAFRLAFDANGQNVMASRRCYGRTIRLVKQK